MPASPSMWGLEIHASEQFAARSGGVPIRPAEVRQRTVLAPPWKLSETPAAIVSPSPRLGEDTHFVLSRMLGYDQERIDALSAAGALE